MLFFLSSLSNPKYFLLCWCVLVEETAMRKKTVRKDQAKRSADAETRRCRRADGRDQTKCAVPAYISMHQYVLAIK